MLLLYLVPVQHSSCTADMLSTATKQSYSVFVGSHIIFRLLLLVYTSISILLCTSIYFTAISSLACGHKPGKIPNTSAAVVYSRHSVLVLYRYISTFRTRTKYYTAVYQYEVPVLPAVQHVRRSTEYVIALLLYQNITSYTLLLL